MEDEATGPQQARDRFHKEGLAFPQIPEHLARQLRRQYRWCFSTREINKWPYFIDAYVDEIAAGEVADYALLAGTGHGVNSYAIHYYLVWDRLALFLQVPYGGVYMNAEGAAAAVAECFELADDLTGAIAALGGTLSDYLTVCGSGFYGSSWWVGARSGWDRRQLQGLGHRRVLIEAREWVESEATTTSKDSQDPQGVLFDPGPDIS